MANHDPIPTKDADFHSFQTILVAAVVANAATWLIPLAEITLLTDAQAVWNPAWAVAQNRQNSTTSQRIAKDDARIAFDAVLRPFIQKWIFRNSNMADTDISECGLKPRDRTRTSVPPPDTIPLVEIAPLPGNKLKVSFRQPAGADGVSRRGKPKGVTQIQFVWKTGTAPTKPEDCNMNHTATRSPFIADFEPEEAGQKVYFYARWQNAKGQGGDWTDVQEIIIP